MIVQSVEVMHNNIDTEVLRDVEQLLHEVFGFNTYTKSVSIPSKFLNPFRTQFRAEAIVEFIAGLRSDPKSIVLGIFDLDAYVEGLNFVFGLADPYLHVATVYIPRLRLFARSKMHILERIRKEVLHELGHVLGLHHCSYPGCVMNFSNSVVEVDMKKCAFCRLCASKLRSRGIAINVKYVIT